MSQAPLNYAVFNRDDWSVLVEPPVDRDVSHVTPSVLGEIKAFNDQISMSDVADVYDPVTVKNANAFWGVLQSRAHLLSVLRVLWPLVSQRQLVCYNLCCKRNMASITLP